MFAMNAVKPDIGPFNLQKATQLKGKLSPTAARALLKLQMSSDVEEHMRRLLKKGKLGTLTAEEHEQMNAYEHMVCVIDMLHARAKSTLSSKAS